MSVSYLCVIIYDAVYNSLAKRGYPSAHASTHIRGNYRTCKRPYHGNPRHSQP